MSKKLYLDKQLVAVDASGDAQPLLVDAQGRLYTVAASSALPDGMATSAKQDALIALLPGALTAGGGIKTGLVDALPAGTASIGAVSSNSVVVSATIARPADTTAYSALDVISASTSAPTVLTFAGMARANGGTGTIVRARLMTDQKTCTARMRLHLFHTSPTAINDNSPYLLLYANAANRIGSIDFPALGTEDSTNSTSAAAMRPSYDGAYAAPQLWYKTKSDGTALYGILETLDAFTPASAQNFYVELGADGLN